MIKKDKIKDLNYVLTGVLTAAEIESASDEILLKHGKDAKIPGFRPGKAPIETLRQKYGNAALSEAVDKLLQTDMDTYVADKKIRLAAAPKADVPKFELGRDLEYTIEFDILPTLPALDLSKFTITKKVAEVPESEITKAMDNLLKARATYEVADAGAKAENGDTVVIDFKGFVGKEAFEGGEAKSHHLNLGSGQFIPGFEDQITGHKKGDKFDVNVEFPKQYHSDKLAGAKARFEVEIHEIKKQKLPEMTDELAKEVGQESVAALSEHIKKILSEQYEEASMRDARNDLLDMLADKVKINLPESLVAQEAEMSKQESERQGKKFDEKAERKDAERRVKLGLILAEWGGVNNISVENSDLQKAVWEEAARYPNPQEVFEFYNKNPNALSMVRGMLFERKALDAMIGKCNVKDKPVKADDLFKQK
ncbi:MAG: trigger factor [Alphaproteobacteria bacterium]|nr:trigger factor [Alphaproteobacteria bacterium]